MSTKKLQVLDYTIKQAENADTVDNKHASDFASAVDMSTAQSDISDLQAKVGDTAVSTQISNAINAIDYHVDSVNGKTGAVTLSASDVGALPLSGGDMTGEIRMNGQPISGLNDPTEETQAATKAYADKMLAKTGGTMTGSIAMGGNRIGTLGDPIYPDNAATKAYVDGRKKTATATLTAAGWSGNTQTVSVSGVTASNTVIVAPDPASFSAYAESGIRCTAQATGTLTFACEGAPTANLVINVVILA